MLSINTLRSFSLRDQLFLQQKLSKKNRSTREKEPEANDRRETIEEYLSSQYLTSSWGWPQEDGLDLIISRKTEQVFRDVFENEIVEK